MAWRGSHLLLLVLIVLLFQVASTSAKSADEQLVQTDGGLVSGLITEESRQFLGIPYGEPPVGQLRWADPKPVQAWAPSILRAHQFAPGCPQRCVLPPHTCPETTSEDCLYLNVFTPRQNAGSSDLLPVMVFMPGGRFEQGTAGVVLYNSSYVVNRTNVVIVTLNYRLGALGSLYFDPHKSNNPRDKLAGNFGFHDQQLALQWIRRNIAAFGGDPKHVTLFGQSAGATSTVAHMIAASSVGLFSQAIIQSNPITLPLQTLSYGSKLGSRFNEDAHCDIKHATGEQMIACLRNQSIEVLLAAQQSSENHLSLTSPLKVFLPWTPIVDGIDILQQPFDAFVAGKFASMPTMLGTVRHEGVIFVDQAWTRPVSSLEYGVILLGVFHEQMKKVLDMYPLTNASDARPALATMATDYIFTCPNRVAVRAIAKSKEARNNTFFYNFDHVLSFSHAAWGPNYSFCFDQVCHGSELPFHFHAFSDNIPTLDEEKLSRDMVIFWTNFAWTGNPNIGPNSPSIKWPEYSADSDLNMRLTTPPQVQQHLLGQICDKWDSIGYHY